MEAFFDRKSVKADQFSLKWAVFGQQVQTTEEQPFYTAKQLEQCINRNKQSEKETGEKINQLEKSLGEVREGLQFYIKENRELQE